MKIFISETTPTNINVVRFKKQKFCKQLLILLLHAWGPVHVNLPISLARPTPVTKALDRYLEYCYHHKATI